MNVIVRRCLVFLPALLLAAGCASTRETGNQSTGATQGQVAAVGRVSVSGSGHMPSYPALQLALRHEAARQFRVPEERIVLGPVETDGGRTVETTPQYQSVAGGTVQLPPGYAEEQSSHWSASAAVSLKPPAES